MKPDIILYFWFKVHSAFLYPLSMHQNYVRILFISKFDLLSFIISNSDEHEFSSIWKWISCGNDIMNHADCVIKRDFFPQKMHSCSKNIRGI